MNLVFSNQVTPLNITSSIFLAGPSPRTPNVIDWRKEAVQYLKEIGYNGVVFIPCPDFVWTGSENINSWDYIAQVSWEIFHRSIADKIVFWVPRNISGGMPGFTTNTEFGEDLNSGKMVYGRPNYAEKCKYFDNRLQINKKPIFTDLKVMLSFVHQKIGNGSLRNNGEIYIPLFIWETSNFQSWYQSMRKAGNHLIFAKVLDFHNINDRIFSFNLAVSIFIKSENRIKNNEILFSRTDISSVVAYYKDINEQKTYVVLVEEFRSCVNNSIGKTLDLPSGSNIGVNVAPSVTAQHEFLEETGIYIADNSRFTQCSSKQLSATFATHKNHIFKVELNKSEFETLKMSEENNTIFGEDDNERTYVRLLEINNIFKSHADLSTIGAIMLAINT